MDATKLKEVLVNEILALQAALVEKGFKPVYSVADLNELEEIDLRSIKQDLRDMRRTLQ